MKIMQPGIGLRQKGEECRKQGKGDLSQKEPKKAVDMPVASIDLVKWRPL